jgi:acetyltransferase-like isoleucine patch superfamily enzyme
MPKILKPFILNIFGHNVDFSAKISCSFIYSSKIKMSKNSKIGFFNVIYKTKIEMHANSYIGRMNVINGPFTLLLKEKAAVGKNNKIGRGSLGVSYGESILQLGILAKITVNHHLDLTRTITFGDFSILAGVGSQIWTHGYVHAPNGPGRYRIDGEVHIGDNVYIGSKVLINPGVKISDAINVGGNSTISKSLTKPGMYVSQPLRFLEKNFDSIKQSLVEVNYESLLDKVYEKPI